MPAIIALLLAAAPILALLLMADLPPDVLAVVRLGLIVTLFTSVAWLVVDVLRGLRDRWSRFITRPY